MAKWRNSGEKLAFSYMLHEPATLRQEGKSSGSCLTGKKIIYSAITPLVVLMSGGVGLISLLAKFLDGGGFQGLNCQRLINAISVPPLRTHHADHVLRV